MQNYDYHVTPMQININSCHFSIVAFYRNRHKWFCNRTPKYKLSGYCR